MIQTRPAQVCASQVTVRTFVRGLQSFDIGRIERRRLHGKQKQSENQNHTRNRQTAFDCLFSRRKFHIEPWLFGLLLGFLFSKLQTSLSSSAFAVQFLLAFDLFVLAHCASLIRNRRPRQDTAIFVQWQGAMKNSVFPKLPCQLRHVHVKWPHPDAATPIFPQTLWGTEQCE